MIKQIQQDGLLIWKIECPKCKIWGEIDDDQLYGRVSTQCECGFHKTVVWLKDIFMDSKK